MKTSSYRNHCYLPSVLIVVVVICSGNLINTVIWRDAEALEPIVHWALEALTRKYLCAGLRKCLHAGLWSPECARTLGPNTSWAGPGGAHTLGPKALASVSRLSERAPPRPSLSASGAQPASTFGPNPQCIWGPETVITFGAPEPSTCHGTSFPLTEGLGTSPHLPRYLNDRSHDLWAVYIARPLWPFLVSFPLYATIVLSPKSHSSPCDSTHHAHYAPPSHI